MASIPHLANDPPPTYTQRAEAASPSSSEQTFDTIQTNIQNSKHTYSLRKDPESDAVFILDPETDKILYHAYSNAHGRIADVVLYQIEPEKSQLQQVAQSKLPSDETPTIQINIGSHLIPPSDAWIPVEHSQDRDGVLHKTETYRFACGDKPLAWQCQTSIIPSSPSGSSENTWKLLDETHVGEAAYRHKFQQSVQKVIAGGGEMAVCGRDGKGGQQERRRQLSWNDEYGSDVEILALVVLVTILEVKGREDGSKIKGLASLKRRLTIA